VSDYVEDLFLYNKSIVEFRKSCFLVFVYLIIILHLEHNKLTYHYSNKDKTIKIHNTEIGPIL